MIKKLFLVLILISFTACDKITDDVVDPQNMTISLLDLSAPDNFTYSETNTDFFTSVELSGTNQVNIVWFQIKSADGSTDISDIVLMRDDGSTATSGDQTAGDNIFTGKFIFTDDIAAGEYIIEFYIIDNVNYDSENQRKVAVHKFRFDKGEQNIAPVISDLSMPDNIVRGEVFIFTVNVEDQNGLSDIDQVYFDIYRPPNDENRGRVLMVDNGDYEHFGDAVAGDGVYSYKNSFAADANTGTWKFEFEAKDHSNAVSNKIIHLIIVN